MGILDIPVGLRTLSSEMQRVASERYLAGRQALGTGYLARDANAAPGAGIDPARLAFARPGVREQYQSARREYDELQQRRAQAPERIRQMKTKNLDAETATSKRFYYALRGLSQRSSQIENDIRKAEFDLQRAKSVGDTRAAKDAVRRYKDARTKLNQGGNTEQLNEAIDLARDFVYYLEESGKAKSWLGDDYGRQPMSQKVATVLNKGAGKYAAHEQQRLASLERESSALRDTSTIEFKEAYMKEFGVDPSTVMVTDSSGNQKALTKLGYTGQTSSQVGKAITDYEAAKATAQQDKEAAIDKWQSDVTFDLFKEAKQEAQAQGVQLSTLNVGFGYQNDLPQVTNIDYDLKMPSPKPAPAKQPVQKNTADQFIGSNLSIQGLNIMGSPSPVKSGNGQRGGSLLDSFLSSGGSKSSGSQRNRMLEFWSV